MSKEKFTPGKWTVSDDGLVDLIVVGGNYKLIVDITHVNGERNDADAYLISAAPEMYSALKMVCEDCEKLSSWEDMFNIGRPEGSIMPKCPCDECYVKEALMKANGEAFQEVKKRRRIADIAFEMYEMLEHIEDVLDDSSGCGEISVEEIRKVLRKARGEA